MGTRKGQPKEVLKPFKKGYDPRRNMKGAPKLPELKDVIAEILDGKEESTSLETIIKALARRAAKGDTRAAKEILDRYYGSSQQHIDHTSGGDKITEIKINWPKE
jgi:hypothetical protein